MNILDKIIRHKKIELKDLKSRKSLAALKREVLALPKKKACFVEGLRSKKTAVIAEIKRRSPSKGLLRPDFDPIQIALSYQAGGAAALSVLTDKKYFGGSSEILKNVRRASSLPILRKDFTIDEYQVYEARLIGADAVLLITRILSRSLLRQLYSLSTSLGLDVLFEIHDEGDLKKLSGLKARLIGINNRDLSTFRTDLKVTERLSTKTPKGCFLVSESGISSALDLDRLKKIGVGAFLVGEQLMRDKDPGAALRRLLGKKRGSG